MAEIRPFRALRYNPAEAGDLSDVVTQPYDKISPEMQARYYERSPYNLVRIIRGRDTPSDDPRNNVYTRAARDFGEWIERRVLASESQPALYAYKQDYEVPGRSGTRKERCGFIALCHLEDYSAGVVHRHEETLSGPKADRLELLKATRAHFGHIFLLYSDPASMMERELGAQDQDGPWEQVLDEYNSLHSVNRVTEPAAIARVVDAMRDKKLLIADGHHRYETALAYRDFCRASGRADTRAEYVMATFVRAETDGLTVLPTHRVVYGMAGFDWAGFRRAAKEFFEWKDLAAAPAVARDGTRGERPCLDLLADAGRERNAFVAYAGPGKLALLRLRADVDLARLLPDLPASLARLDVVVLHRLVLERLLGISRQAVREEQNLQYVREAEVALEEVDAGKAQVCFLMNPTPVEAVRDNAFSGLVLPQKSTDFYPKLLSGLTIYWLDNPQGM